MDYKIILSNGITINTNLTEFSAEDMASKLNMDAVRALTIGDLSLSKNALVGIMPATDTGNVLVTTTSNHTYNVQDDEYSAVGYTDKINSGSQFCVFGNSVLSGRSFVMARPVVEVEHP